MLIELSEREDARGRSSARFFKGLLIVSLCLIGLIVLLVIVLVIASGAIRSG